MELALLYGFALADVLTNDLNLDIDLNESFAEGVDLDKSRIDSTIESSKLGDQSNVSLGDWLVWVGAEDTTWDSAHSSNARTESIDYHALAYCTGAS